MLYYHKMLILTGVRLGFEREVYSVVESDGAVRLVVNVISGQLSEDLVVQLTTQDSTAQGMCTN